MTTLCFNLMVVVLAGLHLLAPPPQTHAMISKRCQSVCSRSDGQDFCQRCRMRVPMRFGKRTDSSSQDVGGGSRSTIQRSALATNDDDEDESRFEEHKGSSSSSSTGSGGDSLRAESQLLLDSMRNFVRDLDDWNRDLYDQ